MEAIVNQGRGPVTFNGPLEAGIRAVAILGAAFPRAYDLQRLVALDYLLVHTGDVGGPDSLHPPTPLHSAELLVRRKLVEEGLLLTMTRDLVRRDVTLDGIKYGAGENTATFLSALTSSYLAGLKERAGWLVSAVGDHTDKQFRDVMRRFSDQWIEAWAGRNDTGTTGPQASKPRILWTEQARCSLHVWTGPQCAVRLLQHRQIVCR